MDGVCQEQRKKPSHRQLAFSEISDLPSQGHRTDAVDKCWLQGHHVFWPWGPSAVRTCIEERIGILKGIMLWY